MPTFDLQSILAAAEAEWFAITEAREALQTRLREAMRIQIGHNFAGYDISFPERSLGVLDEANCRLQYEVVCVDGIYLQHGTPVWHAGLRDSQPADSRWGFRFASLSSNRSKLAEAWSPADTNGIGYFPISWNMPTPQSLEAALLSFARQSRQGLYVRWSEALVTVATA